MRDDFAVFILSYGRAENVVTYETLKRGKYTGKIYLVCSDDDMQLEEYKKKFEVIVINKDKALEKFDICDNFKQKNVVVFARNECHRIAKEIGVKYFLELDDDYQIIEYKIPRDILVGRRVLDLDKLFNEHINFLEESGAASIAFGQGGDYIGGKDNDFWTNNGRRRKVMNCFFNKTDRIYQFTGRINEDTNCYIRNGAIGKLFITVPYVSITQKATQQNKGGLTEFYLETGTYYKSFYTVMINPSAVKVALMGRTNQRLHHNIDWDKAVPVIIRDEWRKNAAIQPERGGSIPTLPHNTDRGLTIE